MFLNGEEIPNPGPRGEKINDDSFLLLFNAHEEDRVFMLPPRRFGARWTLELSTADPAAEPGSARFGARTEVPVVARSIVVLAASWLSRVPVAGQVPWLNCALPTVSS